MQFSKAFMFFGAGDITRRHQSLGGGVLQLGTAPRTVNVTHEELGLRCDHPICEKGRLQHVSKI